VHDGNLLKAANQVECGCTHTGGQFHMGHWLAGGLYMSIWTILFIILLIAWITGFTVFHVTGALIHLLLVFALISLILHFVMGRRAV
jgi:hypothetical protein